MPTPKYKLNDEIYFINHDMITKREQKIIGIIDFIEPTPDPEEGYEYSLYLPNYDDCTNVFENEIIGLTKDINVNI